MVLVILTVAFCSDWITPAKSHHMITLDHICLNCSQKDTKSVLVSTVDAFQGGERDIIILSCVRTNNTGFIDNHKRTNVALTRARHHLFIVGNLRNLEKNQLWGKVIAMCKARTDGVQSSEAAQHTLSSLNDLVSQESAISPRSRSPKAGKKGKRKRQEEQGESPPMSLSGQSGTPIDDSPVTSRFKETTPVKQSKRRRELPQIDVTQLDSDKENAKQDSEDEELPAFNL